MKGLPKLPEKRGIGRPAPRLQRADLAALHFVKDIRGFLGLHTIHSRCVHNIQLILDLLGDCPDALSSTYSTPEEPKSQRAVQGAPMPHPRSEDKPAETARVEGRGVEAEVACIKLALLSKAGVTNSWQALLAVNRLTRSFILEVTIVKACLSMLQRFALQIVGSSGAGVQPESTEQSATLSREVKCLILYLADGTTEEATKALKLSAQMRGDPSWTREFVRSLARLTGLADTLSSLISTRLLPTQKECVVCNQLDHDVTSVINSVVEILDVKLEGAKVPSACLLANLIRLDSAWCDSVWSDGFLQLQFLKFASYLTASYASLVKPEKGGGNNQSSNLFPEICFGNILNLPKDAIDTELQHV